MYMGYQELIALDRESSRYDVANILGNNPNNPDKSLTILRVSELAALS